MANSSLCNTFKIIFPLSWQIIDLKVKYLSFSVNMTKQRMLKKKILENFVAGGLKTERANIIAKEMEMEKYHANQCTLSLWCDFKDLAEK